MTAVHHRIPLTDATHAWRWGPVTRLGRVALGLGVAFVVLLLGLLLGVDGELVERGSWTARALGVTMLATGGAAALAGLVSLRLLADRSWALVMTVVASALVIVVVALDVVIAS